MDEVARSIRVGSTSDIGYMLGGFVAGEGSFVVTTRQPPFKDGTPRLRFTFQVTVATRDRAMLEALRAHLGYGSITDTPARGTWLPTSTFVIASRKGHNAATIPFCERYLLESAKRRQFELWRNALRSWEMLRPTRYGKGPSECSEEGCTKPVRGRGLCRSHYYRATGY